MDVGSSEDSSLISSGPAKSAHARGTSMLSVVSEAHTGSMTSINTCSQHVRKNSEEDALPKGNPNGTPNDRVCCTRTAIIIIAISVFALAVIVIASVFAMGQGGGGGGGGGRVSKGGEEEECTLTRTIAPDECPTFTELSSNTTPGVGDRSAIITITRHTIECGGVSSTRMYNYTWMLLDTVHNTIRTATPMQIDAFYANMPISKRYGVTAFTNSLFPYFQCIYPGYSLGWSFGLNINRTEFPPKQDRPFATDQCPPKHLLQTKCRLEDGSAPIKPVQYAGYTFAFVGVDMKSNGYAPQSGAVWRQFCNSTLPTATRPSANLNKLSSTQQIALCTYNWGFFSWTHGFYTVYTRDQ